MGNRKTLSLYSPPKFSSLISSDANRCILHHISKEKKNRKTLRVERQHSYIFGMRWNEKCHISVIVTMYGILNVHDYVQK